MQEKSKDELLEFAKEKKFLLLHFVPFYFMYEVHSFSLSPQTSLDFFRRLILTLLITIVAL